MAVTSFIPVLWEAALLKELGTRLVSQYGVNHDYEGLVQLGSSVKINALDDISVGDYVPSNGVTYQELGTTAQTLNIDTYKAWAFKVDDIAKVQAAGELMASAVDKAATKMAKVLDAANFAAMVSGVYSGNVIGADTTAGAVKVTTSAQAKQLVLDLKEKLDDSDTPDEGRVCYVNAKVENLLLGDSNLQISTATNESFRTGYVGRLFGCDIYRTNNMPVGTNASIVIMTHPVGTTEAMQLTETEALRDTNSFKDLVRGLTVSGRKVIRPKAVAIAYVDTVGA